jgi:hypothetical protein
MRYISSSFLNSRSFKTFFGCFFITLLIFTTGNFVSPPKAQAQGMPIFGDSEDFEGQGIAVDKNQKKPEGPGMFERAISWGVTSILAGILSFCILLAKISASLLEVMLKPELYNFSGEKWITEGWIVVRDLCNMFFLLVLLFIAFCTILQVEKYHAKKTLLTLIIIALLINFSKPIAIFIFDGSQLLMNLFLLKISAAQNNGQKYTEGIANAVKIAEIIQTNVKSLYKATYGDIANYLFAIVFVFMLAVCLLCLAVFLIIRLIAVWMLIILSPIGFFAATVPDFKKLSSSWWDALFKYSYYGPAAAFFIWLSSKLALSLTSGNSVIMTAAKQQGRADGNLASLFEKMTNFLPFIAILVFLYASLIMAQQFGIQFAKAVTDRAGKIFKGAGKLGGAGLLAAGTFGQYWRARDAVKGTMKGISQHPSMNWLTKESREKKAKERQGKWEEKTAPFNIATVKKNAKEMENDSQGKIDAMVAKGSAAAILESARRGKLTDLQLRNPKVRALMEEHADFENAVYKNLRDSGNGHLQYGDLTSRGKTATAAYDATFKSMSINSLSEQSKLDTALAAERTAGGTELYTKLNNISILPTAQRERMVGPLLTRAKDPDTIAVLTRIYNGLPPI